MSEPPQGSPPPPESSEIQFPYRQGFFLLLAILPVFPLFLISNRSPLNLPSLSRSTRELHDVVNLTLSLSEIPSPSGYEQKVFQYAETWLTSYNVTIQKQPIPPLMPSHLPRENILAVYGNIRDVKVLLCTHLDTVPGGPPTSLTNDRLIGRGVVDAKGQAAALMLTFVEMADPRIALLLVSGEETDHQGMIYASKMGLPKDVTLVNGEPTEGMIASRQKGLVRGVIKAIGKRAHSGYPRLGESAVNKLVDVLVELQRLWPGNNGETMNVGIISGGTAANVVAGEAEASITWRVMDKAEMVVHKVKDVVGRFKDVSFDVISMNDALELHVPEGAAREFGVTEVAYNTDVPYYRGKYKRAIVFGGGSITVAHTEQEAVSISEMVTLTTQMKQLVRELLE